LSLITANHNPMGLHLGYCSTTDRLSYNSKPISSWESGVSLLFIA